MKRNLIGVLSSAALVGGLLAGCGDAEVKEVSNGGTEQKAEKKEEKKDKVYKIGDTVSIDGMEITIDSITWGGTIDGVPAEKGKVLRIEATAKNNSADNGYVDSTEFQVYAGDTKTENYFGNDDANMNAGELKKGKTMKLIAEYDVPATENYEVYYEPSFTLSENAEIKWNISSGDIKE